MIEQAIGAKSIGSITTVGNGVGFSFPDNLLILAREQGPLYRLEVQHGSPDELDHRNLREVATSLLPLAKGAPTHSVGVNFVTLLISPVGSPPPTQDLSLLADPSAGGRLLGTRVPGVSTIKLTRNLRPSGIMNLELAAVSLRTDGGSAIQSALRANFNVDIPTPTRSELSRVLSARRLEQIDRQLTPILKRLVDRSWQP